MKNPRRVALSFDLLLWLWSLAALCAAGAHLLAPAWTAAGTVWPSSPHWQREIACFDLVLALLFIGTARQADLGIKRNITLLLCGLSLLLGENHLEGWLQQPKIFHLVFTVANFAAVLWALGACWRYRVLQRPAASLS